MITYMESAIDILGLIVLSIGAISAYFVLFLQDESDLSFVSRRNKLFSLFYFIFSLEVMIILFNPILAYQSSPEKVEAFQWSVVFKPLHHFMTSTTLVDGLTRLPLWFMIFGFVIALLSFGFSIYLRFAQQGLRNDKKYNILAGINTLGLLLLVGFLLIMAAIKPDIPIVPPSDHFLSQTIGHQFDRSPINIISIQPLREGPAVLTFDSIKLHLASLFTLAYIFIFISILLFPSDAKRNHEKTAKAMKSLEQLAMLIGSIVIGIAISIKLILGFLKTGLVAVGSNQSILGILVLGVCGGYFLSSARFSFARSSAYALLSWHLVFVYFYGSELILH